MTISHRTLHRIWALSIAGDPKAIAEKDRIHAAHPEMDQRFSEFKRALSRVKDAKKRKTVHKAAPTVWTKAQEKFLTSTNGNAVPVRGGSTGLKR